MGAMSDHQRDAGVRQDDTTSAPKQPEMVDQPGVREAQAHLERGDRSPQAYADIIRANPAGRHQIIELLQRTLGNGAVQHVLDASREPAELPLGQVRVHGAAHGLRVRSTPDQSDNVLGMLRDHETTNATARADRKSVV